MRQLSVFVIVLLAVMFPAAAEDVNCGLLAERLSPTTPLAHSLTAIFCREAAAKKWIVASDVESVRTAADFRHLLQKRAAKDVLDIGESLFESFEKSAAAVPAASGWIVRDTPHYRIFVRPESAAARDLGLIAREMEHSRTGIARDFALEPALAAREAVISTATQDAPGAKEPSNRVAVFLYSNRADDHDKRVGKNSMGSTQFGATIDAGKGRLRPSIHVLYYNLFSIAVIEHEIAHTTVMLSAFDPSAIDVPLAGEKDLRKAFFAGYRKLPGFLSEGVGDYGLYYAGFYPAWGLLGPPESMASSLLRGGTLPPLDRLLRADAKMHARGHKSFSLAASTFLRYLLQTQKPESVRDWLFDGASTAEFQKRFGLSVSDAEKAWAAWLEK